MGEGYDNCQDEKIMVMEGYKMESGCMDILSILKEHYPVNFDKLEMMRDAGSTSYTVFSGDDKYFLRVIKPALFNTAITGADIQVFLQNQQKIQFPQSSGNKCLSCSDSYTTLLYPSDGYGNIWS